MRTALAKFAASPPPNTATLPRRCSLDREMARQAPLADASTQVCAAQLVQKKDVPSAAEVVSVRKLRELYSSAGPSAAPVKPVFVRYSRDAELRAMPSVSPLRPASTRSATTVGHRYSSFEPTQRAAYEPPPVPRNAVAASSTTPPKAEIVGTDSRCNYPVVVPPPLPSSGAEQHRPLRLASGQRSGAASGQGVLMTDNAVGFMSSKRTAHYAASKYELRARTQPKKQPESYV